MKTIIAATDYSEASRNAVNYAASLAKQMEARLVLYHGFFLPTVVTEFPVQIPTLEDLMAEHEAGLGKTAQEITKKLGITVDYFTGPMPVIDQLIQLVKREHADLVVMGMKELSAFDRRLFGSTTTAVIRQADFPVLVIPEKASFRKLTHILFACDYHALKHHNKLPVLRELALAFDAQVRVLHVEQPEPLDAGRDTAHGGQKLPNLELILEGVKHHYVFVKDEHAIEGIQAGTDAYHADLLVMVPQKHGFWDIVMNRSHTRRMAFHTHVPLLALPNPGH